MQHHYILVLRDFSSQMLNFLYYSYASHFTSFLDRKFVGLECPDFALYLKSWGELKKLVEEGKIKYIGLSEAFTETIGKSTRCSSDNNAAVGVVQKCGGRNNSYLQVSSMKLSFFFFYELAYHFSKQYFDFFRELGIGIVAYSRLGRGIPVIWTKVFR